MGSDDLHHKRKQQTHNELRRKISRRNQHEVVLLVCEGKKSEPHYLRAFCNEHKLNNARVKILGLGFSPLKLVNHALKEFSHSKDYDRVFCIFDKDQHPCYYDAIKKITLLRERPRNPVPIYAITSVPCFEYWLLLHFTDSTKPYASTGNKSAGDQVQHEIKSYIKDYQKGHVHIFEKTKSNLKIAMSRARNNAKRQENNITDNPSTKIYELLEYLEKM